MPDRELAEAESRIIDLTYELTLAEARIGELERERDVMRERIRTSEGCNRQRLLDANARDLRELGDGSPGRFVIWGRHGHGLYALRVRTRRRDFRTWRAWLRTLIRTKLLLDYRQACSECGCGKSVTWHAPDALYEQVVGSFGRTPCPRCFDRLAHAEGVYLVWRPVVDSETLDDNGDWAW